MQEAMQNKIVIVTGANSGIGKMTAVGLARAGATVVMACRDLTRSDPAVAEVRSVSGSDRVHLMPLDLASQASIRAFAQAYTTRFERLDVLVNNAGVASPERHLTADGFELHFGVHHLGHFLLTTLLLPTLERSAPSRVIVVVGSAQRIGTIDWDDLQSERNYSWMRASGQSRVANLLFVRALAQRAHGVTVNGLDPGNTDTGISRDLPAPVRLLSRVALKSPEKGARTSIYLATSSDVAHVTGRYFKNTQETIRPNPIALDDAAAQRLWDISEQLTAESATHLVGSHWNSPWAVGHLRDGRVVTAVFSTPARSWGSETGWPRSGSDPLPSVPVGRQRTRPTARRPRRTRIARDGLT